MFHNIPRAFAERKSQKNGCALSKEDAKSVGRLLTAVSGDKNPVAAELMLKLMKEWMSFLKAEESLAEFAPMESAFRFAYLHNLYAMRRMLEEGESPRVCAELGEEIIHAHCLQCAETRDVVLDALLSVDAKEVAKDV